MERKNVVYNRQTRKDWIWNPTKQVIEPMSKNTYSANDRLLLIIIKTPPINMLIIQVYISKSNSEHHEIEQMFLESIKDC